MPLDAAPSQIQAGPRARHETVAVRVGEGPGAVIVGGGAPIVVQSMTNTDTADIEGTVKQVAALARAGSEIVRITVDRDEAAAAVPHIREKLDRMGVHVPLVGDFHYIGHKLLTDYPDCAKALAKYRINPGNVGFKDKKDRQFGMMVEKAIEHETLRESANWPEDKEFRTLEPMNRITLNVILRTIFGAEGTELNELREITLIGAGHETIASALSWTFERLRDPALPDTRRPADNDPGNVLSRDSRPNKAHLLRATGQRPRQAHLTSLRATVPARATTQQRR